MNSLTNLEKALKKCEELRKSAEKAPKSRRAVGTIELNGKTFPTFSGTTTINVSPIFVSESLDYKMKGMPAIGTACAVGELCIEKMSKAKDLKDKKKALEKKAAALLAFADRNDAKGRREIAAAYRKEAAETTKEAARIRVPICAYCFANRSHWDAAVAGARNLSVLSAAVLDISDLPIFGNVRMVRFEWGGDVQNVTQARNYIRIAKANPGVVFAWWSKNLTIINRAIKLEGRPENVVFIQSSFYTDKIDKPRYDWVDKVFTVWTSEETASAAGVAINCGARHCVSCSRCYKLRKPGDPVEYVHELVR